MVADVPNGGMRLSTSELIGHSGDLLASLLPPAAVLRSGCTTGSRRHQSHPHGVQSLVRKNRQSLEK